MFMFVVKKTLKHLYIKMSVLNNIPTFQPSLILILDKLHSRYS